MTSVLADTGVAKGERDKSMQGVCFRDWSMGSNWRLGWGRVIGSLRFFIVIFLEFPVCSVVVER